MPTSYQKQFRTKIGAEFHANFDAVMALATSSKSVADVKAGLPAEYAPHLEKATTVDQAIDAVLANSDWGGVVYAPVKPVVAKKAIATKVASPNVAAPAVASAVAAPAKRRGNPDALKKAREARGAKTSEQLMADRQTVVNETVAYLKANAGVQPVKALVLALIPLLVGKGAGGTNLSESFIYTTITQTAREDTSPFVKMDIEKRQIGYQLKA